MSIIIACDQHEADQFKAWLTAQGHEASIGNSTASYVDGVATATDEGANQAMTTLWAQYCDFF